MAKPIVTSTRQFTYSDPKHEAEIQEVTQNRSIIFESLVRKNGSSQKLPGGFDLERLPEGSRVDQNGVRFKSICQRRCRFELFFAAAARFYLRRRK